MPEKAQDNNRPGAEAMLHLQSLHRACEDLLCTGQQRDALRKNFSIVAQYIQNSVLLPVKTGGTDEAD